MNRAKFRCYFGLALIAAHIILFFYLLILTMAEYFELEEFGMVASVLLPLFGTYTAAAIKHLVQPSDSQSNPTTLEGIPVMGMVAVYGSFVAYMVCVISWKAFGSLAHDNLITLIGLGETALGAYVGIIVTALFKQADGPPNDSRAAAPPPLKGGER